MKYISDMFCILEIINFSIIEIFDLFYLLLCTVDKDRNQGTRPH